jgi:hypothetical protein
MICGFIVYLFIFFTRNLKVGHDIDTNINVLYLSRLHSYDTFYRARKLRKRPLVRMVQKRVILSTQNLNIFYRKRYKTISDKKSILLFNCHPREKGFGSRGLNMNTYLRPYYSNYEYSRAKAASTVAVQTVSKLYHLHITYT